MRKIRKRKKKKKTKRKFIPKNRLICFLRWLYTPHWRYPWAGIRPYTSTLAAIPNPRFKRSTSHWPMSIVAQVGEGWPHMHARTCPWTTLVPAVTAIPTARAAAASAIAVAFQSKLVMMVWLVLMVLWLAPARAGAFFFFFLSLSLFFSSFLLFFWLISLSFFFIFRFLCLTSFYTSSHSSLPLPNNYLIFSYFSRFFSQRDELNRSIRILRDEESLLRDYQRDIGCELDNARRLRESLAHLK